MALFRQLEEAAKGIALTQDAEDDDFVSGIIDTIERITGIDLTILENALSGFDDLIGGLQTTLNQIGDIFNNLVVTPVNNIVSNVKDWFLNLVGFRETTTTNVTNAVNTATGAAQTAVNVQKEIIQKIAVFDIKSPRPLHESFNPTVYSSFPASSLDYDVNVTIGTTSLGSHVHRENNQTGAIRNTDSTNLGSHGHVATVGDAIPRITVGTSDHLFTCIRVEADGELEGLTVAARPNTTITGLYFRVYLMSATGDMEPLGPESPNQQPSLGDGQITDELTIAWNFDETILVESGAVVAIGMRVTGASLQVVGKRIFGAKQLEGFYPKSITPKMTPGAAVALPESVTEESLDWTNTYVPHMTIGSNLVPGEIPVLDKRNYENLFDIADSNVSAAFSRKQSVSGNGSGMRIRDLAIAWAGTDDGSEAALYISPMTTDKTYSRIHIGAVESVARPPWSRHLFRMSSSHSTGLAVSFKQGSFVLDRKISGLVSTAGYEALVTLPFTWTEGDLIEVWNGEQIDDILYPGRVVVKVNGVTLFNDTISSSVVPWGIGRRYGGFSVQRDNFYNSFRIRDFKIQDVPDV